MRYLVTGSAGFIGSEIVRQARAAGHDVKGLDPAVMSRGDVRDFARNIDELAPDRSYRRYDVAVHCAVAVVSTAEKLTAGMAVAENLEIDAAFFRWAARAQPGRVVYFSSSCAYPAAMAAEPFREDDIDLTVPEWPDGVYGWQKLTGELLAAQLDVPVTIVRPFSVYGPGSKPGFSVSSFTEQARAGSGPIRVWGTGTQVRDYIHVTDVAAAVLEAVAQGINGPVNLSTGVGTAIADVAAMCGTVELQPGEFEGLPYLVGDSTRLRSFYTPQVTLERGIRELLA